MGKWCLHGSLFLGNRDMFKNYKRFDFWHIQTADIGGTKPWKNNCSLIWKLFKFLMTLLAGLFEMRGCWHIGLRWAIVTLWATCFMCGCDVSIEQVSWHMSLSFSFYLQDKLSPLFRKLQYSKMNQNYISKQLPGHSRMLLKQEVGHIKLTHYYCFWLAVFEYSESSLTN